MSVVRLPAAEILKAVRLALGVDQVLPIITLEETRMKQMRNYAERPYIEDIVNWNGTMVSLFDLDQLQADLDSRCVNS